MALWASILCVLAQSKGFKGYEGFFFLNSCTFSSVAFTCFCVLQVWVEHVDTWWELWTGATHWSGSCWAPSTKSSTSSQLWLGASSSLCTSSVFQSSLYAKTEPPQTPHPAVPFASWAPTAMAMEHWPKTLALPRSQTSGQDHSLLWVRLIQWHPVPSSQTKRFAMFSLHVCWKIITES